MNCDETGVRVNEKLRWLHCMSGSGWVYYALHDKRGCTAMDEIGIIPDYRGIMIHDCWKPYFKYEKAEHALCCAHILRELVYTEEVKHQQWAKPLRELLCEMLEARRRNQGCFHWQRTCARGSVGIVFAFVKTPKVFHTHRSFAP